MGLVSSIVQKLGFGGGPVKVIALGLDAAGKTTILYQLKIGEVTTTIPTIGFNVETLTAKAASGELSFVSWDVGGRDKIRPLWRHFYEGAEALVYVVDCNDRDRMEDAADELRQALDDMGGPPLLVYANKQDLPGAMTGEQLAEALGLMSHRTEWFIQPCCAVRGEGLFEGLDWLAACINQKRSGKQLGAPCAPNGKEGLTQRPQALSEKDAQVLSEKVLSGIQAGMKLFLPFV